MSDAAENPSYAKPYAGLRVLDLSQGVAGPYCAMLLAQYGADVIKVEPLAGDWGRDLGKPAGSHSAIDLTANRGKRSIALDLKLAPARALLARMAARCDVVIENFRPGVVDRLGAGYAAVRAANPRVLYLSVSAFGQTGPARDLPGSDTVAQTFSGRMMAHRDAAVLLTSPLVRPYVRSIIERFRGQTVVMCQNEIQERLSKCWSRCVSIRYARARAKGRRTTACS